MSVLFGCLALAALVIYLMCVWDKLPPAPEQNTEHFQPAPVDSKETRAWRRIVKDWKSDNNRWGYKPGEDEIF